MMADDFLKRVAQYIKGRDLLSPSDKCLVGLSGGADSVALLIALVRLGYDVEAVHCNFQLRGNEALNDELFAVQLCEKLGVTIHRVHFDTREYAELHKVSIEMAARELRYDYFQKLAHDIGATAVCVAHHRDDSVETVLLNLFRGTGINGLTGIAAKNNNIIRPLLCVSKADILDFLNLLKQNYVTDSSNLKDDVRRNKVRLNLMPIIKDINPAAQECIERTARRLESVAKIYNDTVNKAASEVCVTTESGGVTIDINKLLGFEYCEDVIWKIVSGFGFTSADAESITKTMASQSGKVFYSADYQLLIDRKSIIIERRGADNNKVMRIPEEGTYVYDENTKLRVSVFPMTDDVKIDKRKCCLMADADRAAFPLLIRKVAPGDRFCPLGMRGSKLVSDFLTDNKLSLFEKQRQLVVTERNNKILWLVNLRPDNDFRVRKETKKIIKIELL